MFSFLGCIPILLILSLVSPTEVTFVPWPHRRLFDGPFGFGNWYTLKRVGIDEIKSIKRMDNIQRSAIVDGYFIPTSIKGEIHLFSAQEARECLAGRKIYFIGDSYMSHMFIGMVDILLGDPSNYVIRGGAIREKILSARIEQLEKLSNSLPQGKKFTVKWVFRECLHSDLFCHIQKFEKEGLFLASSDSIVMNVLVHHMNEHIKENNRVSDYIQLLKRFFADCLLGYGYGSKPLPLTWATGPKYEDQKVPMQWQNITSERHTDICNSILFTDKEFKSLGVPLMDMFTLTGTCMWSNCTADGGHRNRFVNRMKAQMLLNNLCMVKLPIPRPLPVNLNLQVLNSPPPLTHRDS